MKTAFHNFAQSKIALLVTGLLLMSVTGYILVFASEGDADQDGISDSNDLCPATVLVDNARDEWGANRYLWLGEIPNFFVMVPGKDGKNRQQSEFTMVQTKGCSCLDIVKATVGNAGIEKDTDYKSGCTKATLEKWIKSVN